MREIYEVQLANTKRHLKIAIWTSCSFLVMGAVNVAAVVWQLASGRPPFNAGVLLFMVALWFFQQRTIRSFRSTVARYERLIASGA